jgi:hypothetical protein
VRRLLALNPGVRSRNYTRFKSDGAVQALGSFVTGTTDNGVHHTATNSGGVLASYRYYFDRHNGIEVNDGYARNTQNYDQFGVNTNSHEVTAAYVLRFPQRRWSLFVLAGVGGLLFDPSSAWCNWHIQAATGTEDAAA